MNNVRRTTLIRSIAISTIALVALVVLMTAPALAITGTWVADYEHPFVGLVVIYDEAGNFLWRGSGSLISSKSGPHCRARGRYGRGRGIGPRVLRTGCRSQL